jgi:hypothetical protein
LEIIFYIFILLYIYKYVYILFFIKILLKIETLRKRARRKNILKVYGKVLQIGFSFVFSMSKLCNQAIIKVIKIIV